MSLSIRGRRHLLGKRTYSQLNVFISRTSPTSPSDADPSLRIHDGDADIKTLAGQPIAIKDNICVKEFKTTAASGMLKNYASPIDATVIQHLKKAGAVIVGKTNMDEFGMGSHSTNSHFGPVVMPGANGEQRSAGGSSGGSAVAVATSQCLAALGTDTGGSVRLPAAYTGTVGFKPSYGLLSRWGVIAYANSLDTVGIHARHVSHVKLMFDALNKFDERDPTSLSSPTRARLATGKQAPKHLKIGVPVDYNVTNLDPVVRKTWQNVLEQLWKQGHTLHSIRLPATQHALSAYYILAPAEASSNLAKYDGVRYGSRANGIDGTPESVLFAKTRGHGFGDEVQRRILLGSFTLSADAIENYFVKAQQVRRLVQRDFDRAFAKVHPLLPRTEEGGEVSEKVDVLLCPTAPSPAPLLSEIASQDPIQSYTNDIFTVPASLAGLPAISVPVQVSGHGSAYAADQADQGATDEPIGMQIIGQYGDDELVLHAASLVHGI